MTFFQVHYSDVLNYKTKENKLEEVHTQMLAMSGRGVFIPSGCIWVHQLLQTKKECEEGNHPDCVVCEITLSRYQMNPSPFCLFLHLNVHPFAYSYTIYLHQPFAYFTQLMTTNTTLVHMQGSALQGSSRFDSGQRNSWYTSAPTCKLS